MGGNPDDQVGTLVLRSPIAGKLVSAKVARGQTVEPADTLFEVADLSTVWVELRIFERDLASMQVGDAVEITTQASPPQLVKGQVSHVGDILDPETRSAAVRVMVENERRFLRPGQSVHARIQTTMPTGSFLGIPRAAVTRVDGKATVFVLMGKGAVEPRSIKIGLEDAQDVAVLEGLGAGDQVIVGGLFELNESYVVRGEGLLKDENEIGAIIVKFTADGPPVRVKHVADVLVGPALRYGVITHNGQGEAVAGIVMMLLGANSRDVVQAVGQRVKEIQKEEGAAFLP